MNEHSVMKERHSLALDSTQTLRPLTLAELQAGNPQEWFAVQLAISDRPINLDTMPRLQIIASHQLYTIAGRQGAVTRYALRLGFFDGKVSATVVCGYLKTFFPSVGLVRVSAAEHERFAGPSRADVPGKPADTRSNDTSANADAGNVKRAPPAAKPAACQSLAQKAAPAVTRSAQSRKPATSGSSQKLMKRAKSLAEELVEEARQMQRSRTGRNRAAERTGSWLSRLLGGSKS